MKLILPSQQLAANTSYDIMPYEAYFHSLLQSSGASRLELVRDDAIGTDPSEVARFLLGTSTAPPKVDSGLPSLPSRKPSAENLSQILNQSTNSDASDAHCIRDHHNCTSSSSSQSHLRTQRGQGMRSLPWGSERAPRNSLRSFLEDTSLAHSDTTFPQSSSRERRLPARNHASKRQHCRWSASSVPTTVGSG